MPSPKHTYKKPYEKIDRYEEWVKEGKMAGFNVGMNIGECAGQTIMWPHIHFIPRKEKDAEHVGGMRYAHPGADHRKHY